MTLTSVTGSAVLSQMVTMIRDEMMELRISDSEFSTSTSTLYGTVKRTAAAAAARAANAHHQILITRRYTRWPATDASSIRRLGVGAAGLL